MKDLDEFSELELLMELERRKAGNRHIASQAFAGGSLYTGKCNDCTG